MATETRRTSPILVTAAWIVVSIPLGWGIYNTGRNAAKLFTHLHPVTQTTAKPA
jgi:hypothetical protein